MAIAMARKTKEIAAATRRAILDAAEECFLEEGVCRTTLEQVALRAGCTRGAVYWHFDSKRAVLDAVVDRVEVPVFSGLEAMISAAGADPVGALRTFYVRAFTEIERDPHARNAIEIALLKCERAPETEPLFERQRRSRAHAVGRVAEVLRLAAARGQLRAGLDPETCAFAVHCAVLGVLRERVSNPDRGSLCVEGVAVLDVVLAGLGPVGVGPAPTAGRCPPMPE
jgi:TetR/AcrR family acrAB operon transcriptional repressor